MIPTIKKSDLIEILAAQNSITYTESERYLNHFITLVYGQLKKGGAVNISGFGKFEVSHRKPRMGYHPRKGVPMKIPELNTPKFRAGEGFKSAVKLRK